MFERYATHGQADGTRLDYWNQVMGEMIPGMTVSGPTSLIAGWAQCRLGDVRLAQAHSQKATVQGWADRSVDIAAGRVALQLQRTGVSRVEQRHRAAILCAGDITLCSTDEPYRIDMSGRNEMFVLDCPATILDGTAIAQKGFIPFLTQRLPAVGLLQDFATSIFRQQSSESPSPDEAIMLGDMLMHLTRQALMGEVAHSPETRTPRERILAFVDENLCDSGLRTGTIAQRLSLPVRSVQSIFAAMATTPTAFITDRRLAIAADSFRRNLHSGTITDMAHMLGFCDAAHFARRFRARFGMSPGAYIQRCRTLC